MPDPRNLGAELDLLARLHRRSDRARERRGEDPRTRAGAERIVAGDDACYAPPAFLSRVVDASEVDRLRALLAELKAANDEQVGTPAGEQWVLLNGDPAALAWNRALLAWIDRYVARRASRPSPRDGGVPFRTFVRLLDELFPWLETLRVGGAASPTTVHPHYVGAAADFLGWTLFERTWGRQVRLTVGPSPATRVDWGTFPEGLIPTAHDLLTTLHWYPDTVPDRLVQALGGPDPENADERLQDLAEDLAEMRPLLVRGFKPERTVVQVGPELFAAWSWNVGHKIASILTAPTERELLEHLSMSMSDQVVNLAFDGSVCDRYLPWRSFAQLPGGRAAALRLVEPLHERLFSFYDRIDLDAIVRRVEPEAADPGPDAAADAADAVVAASCEVLRRRDGRGRNRSLGVRTTQLFAALERLGCEIRPGKGSEIAIYRPGAKIWTFTHHKRNPRVGWATVRQLLQRLQIPTETWVAAIR